MFKRALEVRTWRFYGCGLVDLVDLMNLNGLSLNQLDQPGLLGESACPFIHEGDGFTSERERVRMLLSLVAHVDGYRMMVGVHNTVGCQMHMGGRSSCLGMADVGTCTYC